MIRTIVFILGIAVLGCGVQGTTVGGPCATRDECEPSFSCNTNAPGGFCSRGCTSEGSQQSCGVTEACTFFDVNTLLCSKYCTADADCRTGYSCAALQGTQANGKKTCQPTNVTR